MRKEALSPQTTLNYLRARSQQGVNVAPRLLDAAQGLVAAGGHTTPAPLRGLALHAAESAQSARRAQQFAAHPIPSARRAAAETVMELEHAAPERMFASPEVLRKAEVPAPSAEKTQMLFGGGGQLHDPDKLMAPSTSQMLQQLQGTAPPISGVRPASASEAGTAVGRVPRRPVPAPTADVTAVQRPLRKIGAALERHPISFATSTPGRLKGQLPRDPAETARTAFWGNQRQVEESIANTPKLAFSYQDLRRLGNRPVSSFFRRGAQAAETQAAPAVNKIVHRGMEVTPNLKGEVDFMMPLFGGGKVTPGGAQPVQFGHGSYSALSDAGALVVPDYVKNFKPSELVEPAFVRGESPTAHAAAEPVRRKSKRQMAMWMDPVPPPQAAARTPLVSAPAPAASAPAPAASAPVPVTVPPATPAPATNNRLRYVAGGLAATGALGAGGAYLANREAVPPQQKAASVRLAAWAEKQSAAHKLDGRTTFRGLEISIETGKGRFRYWYDPHEKRQGKTKMLYPYGYIRRTKGLDGDHVDVFIGPNEQAENVYVILTKKAPDFEKDDEEKCMLGFDSLEAAKKAFRAHYDDPRFISDVTAVPFSVFATRVKETFDGKRKKVAGDTGAPRRNLDTVYWGGHAGGSSRPEFQAPTGIVEKPRGLAPAGESKLIIGEPALRQDRIDRSFGYMDNDQNTTAIEGAWGSPGTASTSIP